MTDRYAGKPFLKMLDSYILEAIGALDSQAEAELAALEPEVRKAYGVSGSWREIVVTQMNFPDGFAGAVRELWEKGRPKFVASQGREPDPVEFARGFVDTKFAR